MKKSYGDTKKMCCLKPDKAQSKCLVALDLKSIVMRCAIWYYLYKLKNVKTPMEECYF